MLTAVSVCGIIIQFKKILIKRIDAYDVLCYNGLQYGFEESDIEQGRKGYETDITLQAISVFMLSSIVT